MNKIIVISGKQYSGKDTLAKLLLADLGDFVRVGIGDAIKIQYAREHNLTFEEVEKNKHIYRSALIELGNWGRSQDCDFWLKSIVNMPDNIIVPDVRLIHEIVVFKSFNAFCVRVEADFEHRSKRAVITNENDLTETELDNYKNWDFTVDNNSDLEHLKEQKDRLLAILRKNYL